jgi:hypothetical protein
MSNTNFSEMQRIRKQFDNLQNMFQKYLPKVDPDLIYDLLIHLRESPTVTPMYTLEVFTKPGVDSKAARDFIHKKTGTVPTVYGNGTHYVTNQKLTLEILKEISDSKDVIEVTGASTNIGCWFSDSVKRGGI